MRSILDSYEIKNGRDIGYVQAYIVRNNKKIIAPVVIEYAFSYAAYHPYRATRIIR